MFAEEELIPTEAESGLWYYQGIDETDGAGPSTVPVIDRSVPFAPSSVPASERRSPPVPAKHTRLRFVSSRRRGGHDAERRSPVRQVAPDHLEQRDSVTPPQQDSAAVHDTKTFDQGTTELPRKDAVLPPQQDTIVGASDSEQGL
ncbi:hypothetical protein Q3G72_005239 [Acer saccharum]|nr:hypothetical protein Q3G72_005239 [Acer saccharum]